MKPLLWIAALIFGFIGINYFLSLKALKAAPANGDAGTGTANGKDNDPSSLDPGTRSSLAAARPMGMMAAPVSVPRGGIPSSLDIAVPSSLGGFTGTTWAGGSSRTRSSLNPNAATSL